MRQWGSGARNGGRVLVLGSSKERVEGGMTYVKGGGDHEK